MPADRNCANMIGYIDVRNGDILEIKNLFFAKSTKGLNVLIL